MELQSSSRPGRKAGVSGVVLFFGGVFLVGLGVAAGAFLFSGNGDAQGGKIAAVSKTLSEVFGSSVDGKPVLEIDLAARRAERVPESSAGEEQPAGGELRAEAEAGNSIGIPASPRGSGADTEANSAMPVVLPPEKPAVAAPDCNFASVGPPSQQVLINEVAWMGTETSTSDEWLEFKNISAASLSLAGWRLLSQDGGIKIVFGAGDSITPFGYFLLERSDDNSVPGAAADKIYAGALPNAGEWLKLLDAKCNLVDEVNAAYGWNLGGNSSSKQTLERNYSDSGWHTSSVAGGTPRAANSAAAAVQSTTFSVSASPSQPSSETSVAGKININTAGYEELQKITGVGPVIAQRIIDYRNASGPFQKIEDIKNVKGIGDVTFEKMRDEIAI